MKIKKLWTMPANLGEYGSDLYASVGRKAVQNGTLEDSDRSMFISLCQSWQLSQMAWTDIIANGIVADGDRKTIKKAPSFTIYKASMDNYVRLCTHFGLSPLSRGDKFIITSKPTAKEKHAERFFKVV